MNMSALFKKIQYASSNHRKDNEAIHNIKLNSKAKSSNKGGSFIIKGQSTRKT